MSTVYRKGQGTIAEVFIFYAIVMSNIFIVFLMMSGGGTFVQKVEPQINYQMASVKAESTVTATTNDYLWRSDQVEPGKYNLKLANELMSLYFSTPGDTIYFGEQEIPKSELGSDLETYMKYKMEKIWKEAPYSINYYLGISYDSVDSSQTLSVSSDGYQPSTDDSKRSFPVALTNGETAQAVLWVESGQGIYPLTRIMEADSS